MCGVAEVTTLLAFLLRILKWPVAIAAAALTPGGVMALWELLQEAWAISFWRSPFAIGFGVTLVAWGLLSRRRTVSFWCTMEHEFTHALFAWATLVRVVEFRATDGSRPGHSAGHVVLGGSNFLISTAPYFFPTAAALLTLAIWALAIEPTDFARALLGAATAFSAVSTWQETHREQQDLVQEGFAFAWLFLPGANLLCYGTLLADQLGGWRGAMAYSVRAYELTAGYLNW